MNLRYTAAGSLGSSMFCPYTNPGTWLRSRYRDCCLGSMNLRYHGSMRKRPSVYSMQSCCRVCGPLLLYHRGSSRLVGPVGPGNRELGGGE